MEQAPRREVDVCGKLVSFADNASRSAAIVIVILLTFPSHRTVLSDSSLPGRWTLPRGGYGTLKVDAKNSQNRRLFRQSCAVDVCGGSLPIIFLFCYRY